MSTKYKTEAHKLYYVTLTVVGWMDVFTRKEYVNIIFDSIRYCQANKGLELFAYVVMPEEHELCRRSYLVGWPFDNAQDGHPPNTTDERKTLARAGGQPHARVGFSMNCSAHGISSYMLGSFDLCSSVVSV